jgi:hypothetical protein
MELKHPFRVLPLGEKEPSLLYPTKEIHLLEPRRQGDLGLNLVVGVVEGREGEGALGGDAAAESEAAPR